jgi:hypothetical protein
VVGTDNAEGTRGWRPRTGAADVLP